jgi:DNA-binding transcriptional LysR family regulator
MFELLFAKRGLSLDRLRAFIAVADAGGIARAVGGDPVRQSQYSRQIAELEEFFGVELLQRRGRRVVVSPAGEQLARAVREQFRGLVDFARACGDEPVSFAIGAGDSLVQWLLLPRLAALHARFPGVSFRLANLTTQNIVEALRELTLDFGIARADGLPAGLGSHALGTVEYALLIPRTLLRPRQRHPDFVSAISEFPIATQAGTSQFAAHLREIAASAEVRLRLVLECESFPQALGALRTGHYAAILPRLALSELDARAFIEVPAPQLTSQRRKIVLAWNPRTLRLREQAPALAAALKAALTLS